METNIVGPNKSEKTMWFSMWFLAAIVTFGLAFLPMFYRSIERRNQHFARQREIEEKTSEFFGHEEDLLIVENPPLRRSGILWTASIVLVIPAFVILYFLSSDLMLHEKNQQTFLRKILPGLDYKPQEISVGIYLLITLSTLGVGGIYWLYRVFNWYNNHFREHQIIDYEICNRMEASTGG